VSPELQVPPSNVTILGAFNASILRPEWLSRHVFGEIGEYQIFITGTIPAVVIQRRADVLWWVQQDRLVVASDEITRATEFVTKLLRILSHTPVLAAGVNFQQGAALSHPGQWYSRLADLKNAVGALKSESKAAITLRSARNDRTSLTCVVQEVELPLVTFDFNFSLDARAQQEGERIEELISHISRAAEFEGEARAIIAEVVRG